jgi:amino acid transporter
MEITKHGLRRQLRLRDLVPMQVVLIVWLGWTGFSAKQGTSQITLWLLAIMLFYLPLAAVLIKLSRAIPLEGGVYQWVKEGISPFAGYLAGWNFTIYAVTAFAVAGSFLANGFAHAAPSLGPCMSGSKTFALGLTAASASPPRSKSCVGEGSSVTRRQADQDSSREVRLPSSGQ